MASYSAPNNVSSISMALAGKSASVNIPEPRVLARGEKDTSVGTSKRANALPTPPNSISPDLPARRFRKSPATASGQGHDHGSDSDIDLQDAVDHENKHVMALGSVLSDQDATSNVTPAMLAANHLPDIMLKHGPMAIRHIMSHLGQSVLAFSRIPPAKARRIVVTALESQTGGAHSGEVEFEKVGWGRWDARTKGQPPRDRTTMTNPSPPASLPSSYTPSSLSLSLSLSVPKPRPTRLQNPRDHDARISLEKADEKMEDVDMNMATHEADKMSLDDEGREPPSCSSSEAALEDLDPLPDDDMADLTDEEDWANIGAAALRQGSISAASGGGGGPFPLPTSKHPSLSSITTQPSLQHRNQHRKRVDYSHLGTSLSASRPVTRVLARSLPGAYPFTANYLLHNNPSDHHYSQASRIDDWRYAASSSSSSVFVGPGVVENPREREAAEALLRMGSM